MNNEALNTLYYTSSVSYPAVGVLDLILCSALRSHQTFTCYIPAISHILLRACYFSPLLLNCVLSGGETRALLIALADLELSYEN